MEKEDRRANLVERAKTCKICAMALSAFDDGRSARDPARGLTDDSEDPYECEIWWEFARIRSSYERPLLCIVEEGYGSACFKFRETLSFFLESALPAENEVVGQSQYVSYRVLRAWYDKCLGHGGTLQDLFLINELKSTTIRLIDGKNQCLCDVPTSEAYIALSYVWGTSQEDKNDMLTTVKIEQLYAVGGINRHLSLARTVRDVIEVTRELGFQYLFVDRLCILQDSSRDKALYVNAMHEIYNKAKITIVAAAGTSAQAGLPGTRGTPRTKSRLYHPRQFVRIDEERDVVRVHRDELVPAEVVQKHLENSVWATRGWTFQEEKLSERMLIFTDQVVLWKCSYICSYEDCVHDLHEQLSQNLMDMPGSDAFGRDTFWWFRQKDRGQPVGPAGLTEHDGSDFQNVSYSKDRDRRISIVFRLRVQEFFERKLTYPNDIARAFNGMIGAFKIVYEPLPVHHGMLTRSLPSELTWACVGCATESHTSHERHLGLRSPAAENQGVSSFPTWSWHAWLNEPGWFYGERGPATAMREMEHETAMTTSIYAGISNPPSTKLVYRETRPIEWRSDRREFTPALWMTQHSLRDNALIFMALTYRADQSLWRPPAVLLTLAGLNLQLPGDNNIPIVSWLQRPSRTAFQRPMGVVCLSCFEETSATSDIAYRMAAMLLVSYQTVEGTDVAFREGLFTCEASSLDAARRFFEPQTVFLC